MTDNGYLMQYFLEHSPKDTDNQKKLKTALTEKENLLNKKAEDAGHE